VFTGKAHPAAQVVARVFNEAGELVRELQGDSDAAGNWLLQAPGLGTQQNFLVDFGYAGGGGVGYGDFSVDASTDTYRPRGNAAQWGLTNWAQRQYNSLQQMHDEHGNPIDF